MARSCKSRNLGDNEVGGDEFDSRLRNLVRQKHGISHKIDDVVALEQPGMAAKLLDQCELVKIALSKTEVLDEIVFIGNYLRINGGGQHLAVTISGDELEKLSEGIVNRGLARIDEILEGARLTYEDLELCLATSGMVGTPAIRNGLTERFLGRVPNLTNGDRIIAEGAAWIAHDGLRLTLSKAHRNPCRRWIRNWNISSAGTVRDQPSCREPNSPFLQYAFVLRRSKGGRRCR